MNRIHALWPGIAALSLLQSPAVAAAGGVADASAAWNDRLASHGVEIKAGYTSEDFRNIGSSGPSAGAHAGQLSLSSAFDLEKLLGLPEAELHLDVSYRDGRNLQDRGVVTLLQPQEVYGRGQTWRLSGLWFGKQVLDGRISLKAGRMTVGSDFADLECTFVNQGLCGTQPGNINGNYWLNWPISQWAMTGQLHVSADMSIKAGVYQVNPNLLARGHRFTINPSGTVGALLPLEFGWAPHGDKGVARYRIGGWYTSAPARRIGVDEGRQLGEAATTDQMRTSGHGGYLIVEQPISTMVEGEESRGLRGLMSVTLSDRKTSFIDRTISLGAIYRGLSTARQHDEFGIGVSAVHLNDRLQHEQARLLQRGERVLPPDSSEYTVEIFYAWQAAPSLRFQPDMQWIMHSGHGSANREDYLIAGVKTIVQF